MKNRTPNFPGARIIFLFAALCGLLFAAWQVPALAAGMTDKTTLPPGKGGSGSHGETSPVRYESAGSAVGAPAVLVADSPGLPILRGEPSGLPLGVRARLGGGTLRGIALSPDGNYVATGGGIGVKVYRRGTYDLVWHRLSDGLVTGVSYSPDGSSVAGVNGAAITIYNAMDGAPIRSLGGASEAVSRAVFSPDGKRLAAVSGAEVLLWDLASAEPFETFRPEEKVSDIAWSPDGRVLALGAGDIDLWNPSTGDLFALETDASQSVICVAWSADGKFIAAGMTNGSVLVWDMGSKEYRFTAEIHDLWVSSVAISPDGKWLGSGGRTGEAVIWNVRTGEPVQILEGHRSEVTQVVFAPDGRLLTAGLDNIIIEWDPSSGEQVQSFAGHTYAINSVAWSPNGAWIASGGVNGEIRVWEAASGQCIALWGAHEEAVTNMVWSPDSSRLASLSADGTARVWDAGTGKLAIDLKARQSETEGAFMPDGMSAGSAIQGAMLDAAFSADGKWLATGGEDTQVIIWDLTSGEPLHILEGHTMPVYSVSFQPGSGELVSMSVDGTMIRWASANGQLLASNLYAGKATMAASPNLTKVALGEYEGSLEIWDAERKAPAARLDRSSDVVIRARISPESGLVAAGVERVWDEFGVWDIESGQMVGQFSGHNGDVKSVAFSPDGGVLASASWDGTVLLWDMPNLAGEPMARQ